MNSEFPQKDDAGVPMDCPGTINYENRCCKTCLQTAKCTEKLKVQVLRIQLSNEMQKEERQRPAKRKSRKALRVTDPLVEKKVEKFADLVSMLQRKLEKKGILDEDPIQSDQPSDIIIGFLNSYLDYHYLMDEQIEE